MPKSRLYLLYAAVGIFVAIYLYKRYRTIPSTPFSEIEVVDASGNSEPLGTALEYYEDRYGISAEGKIVVVNYFASWCGPCMAEMPALTEYYNSHKEEVLLIGLTDDPIKKMMATMKNFGMLYPVLRIEDLNSAGINSIPATAIYNTQGVRTDFHMGILDANSLDKLVSEARTH